MENQTLTINIDKEWGNLKDSINEALNNICDDNYYHADIINDSVGEYLRLDDELSKLDKDELLSIIDSSYILDFVDGIENCESIEDTSLYCSDDKKVTLKEKVAIKILEEQYQYSFSY